MSASGSEDRTFCRRVRSSIYPSIGGKGVQAFDVIPWQFRSSLAVVTLLGEKFLANGTTCRKLPERLFRVYIRRFVLGGRQNTTAAHSGLKNDSLGDRRRSVIWGGRLKQKVPAGGWLGRERIGKAYASSSSAISALLFSPP